MKRDILNFFFAPHREGAAGDRRRGRAVPAAVDGRQGEDALHQRRAERGPAHGQRGATGGAPHGHQRHHPGRLPPAQSAWGPPACVLPAFIPPAFIPPKQGLHSPSPESHLEGNQPAGSYRNATII